MVNPISNAYNFFVWLWQAMPYPVQALVLLAVGLLLINMIINVVFK